jgi:hypothetical protein
MGAAIGCTTTISGSNSSTPLHHTTALTGAAYRACDVLAGPYAIAVHDQISAARGGAAEKGSQFPGEKNGENGGRVQLADHVMYTRRNNGENAGRVQMADHVTYTRPRHVHPQYTELLTVKVCNA